MTGTTLTTAPLGRTGLQISRVGLGAWAMGGPWEFGWGPQDDADSVRAIREAVERGVSWIDTAAVYGLGHSEEIVGRAVAEIPAADRPLVFTKGGEMWDEHGTITHAAHSLKRECEDSLRRLGVDVIDLYQIHQVPKDGTSVEEAWQAMVELRDEGKIRCAGVSNFGPDLLDRIEPLGHVDTLQPPLSLLNRRALEGTLQWCAEHDTGVIVYSPMQSGVLSGRWSRERFDALPDDDWRRGSEWFQGVRFEQALQLVERLNLIAADQGCTVAELAIAWALEQPGVTGAIVGARSPGQVEGWVRAGEVRLSGDTLSLIGDAVMATGAGRGPVAG